MPTFEVGLAELCPVLTAALRRALELNCWWIDVQRDTTVPSGPRPFSWDAVPGVMLPFTERRLVRLLELAATSRLAGTTTGEIDELQAVMPDYEDTGCVLLIERGWVTALSLSLHGSLEAASKQSFDKDLADAWVPVGAIDLDTGIRYGAEFETRWHEQADLLD